METMTIGQAKSRPLVLPLIGAGTQHCRSIFSPLNTKIKNRYITSAIWGVQALTLCGGSRGRGRTQPLEVLFAVPMGERNGAHNGDLNQLLSPTHALDLLSDELHCIRDRGSNRDSLYAPSTGRDAAKVTEVPLLEQEDIVQDEFEDLANLPSTLSSHVVDSEAELLSHSQMTFSESAVAKAMYSTSLALWLARS